MPVRHSYRVLLEPRVTEVQAKSKWMYTIDLSSALMQELQGAQLVRVSYRDSEDPRCNNPAIECLP